MPKDVIEREAADRDRRQKRGLYLNEVVNSHVVTAHKMHKDELAWFIGVHSADGTNWRIMVKNGVAEAVDMVDSDTALDRQVMTIPITEVGVDEGFTGESIPESIESSKIIESYDSTEFNGAWVPAVEVYLNEVDINGVAHQRFILHDNTVFNRFPVDRVGMVIELSDPQVRIDEWKRLNTHDDQDGE